MGKEFIQSYFTQVGPSHAEATLEAENVSGRVQSLSSPPHARTLEGPNPAFKNMHGDNFFVRGDPSSLFQDSLGFFLGWGGVGNPNVRGNEAVPTDKK